jgi:SAM-dependent methyltransferase
LAKFISIFLKLAGIKQIMKILEQLKLPETRQIEDLDDIRTTILHGEILQNKGFLEKLYLDFYRILKNSINTDVKNRIKIIELGSGGGFIKNVIPGTITSDVLQIPSVDLVFSAEQMPFEDQSVDSFVMIDVLHHLCDVESFFREVVRCLKPGGVVSMIEPANTIWGRFIYQHFHPATFDPKAEWKFESKGPLSTANGALPWIVFHRDNNIFTKKFPELEIIKTRFHTPLRYLISGGFTLRQLAPTWSYTIVKWLEFLLWPFNRWIGPFETIIVEKRIQ